MRLKKRSKHSPRSMAGSSGSSSSGSNTFQGTPGYILPESPFPDNPDSGDSSPHLLIEPPGEDYLQYSKNTSDYPEKLPEDESVRRVQELTEQIRDKLIKNAEMEKLTEFLDSRLSECGWKLDIRNILRVEVKNGKCPKVEELYDLVRERGKMLVPRQIRREMIKKIQESYTVEVEGSDASSCAGSDRSA